MNRVASSSGVQSVTPSFNNQVKTISSLYESPSIRPFFTNTFTPTVSPAIQEFQLLVPNSEKGHCNNCTAFVGTKEYTIDQVRAFPRYSSNFSISIVSTSTSDRLAFLPYILERWEGDIVVSLQVTKRKVKEVSQQIQSLLLPSRVTIILKVTSNNCNHFYINLLRNIAIKSIRTTHFIVLDMDMWPLPTAYTEFSNLPVSILNSTRTAVIIPSVFIRSDLILSNCTTLLDCALKSSQVWPTTKEELEKCIRIQQCSMRKRKALQHMYVAPLWHRTKSPYLKMKCFANVFQEPYVLLKYDEDMVLYDERFVDYGCNKVQLINLYRMMGYDFYILTKTFALDISHHDSKYREGYMTYARAGMRNKMGKLCSIYLAKTQLEYANQNKVNICTDLYE